MNIPLSRRILTLAAFILFLNLFFFHSFGTFGYILLTAGFFGFILGMYADFKEKNQTVTIGGFFGFLALLWYVLLNRTSSFVEFILGVSIFGILGLTTYTLSTRIPFVRSLMELILSPLNMFLSYLLAGINTLTFPLAANSRKFLGAVGIKDLHLSKWISVALGLFIGLPIVFILISMFSSADPIFAYRIKEILSEGFLKELPGRIILSGFFLALFAPFLFLHRKKEFHSPLSFISNVSFVPGMSIIMGLVALTIGAFLLIQWPYVFANVPAETKLAEFGVATYSEYVKKGFGELLQIALFIYLLIWGGLLTLRGKATQLKKILMGLQLVVLAEFGVFLLSVFRRVWLYQAYHGWSLIRIYGVFLLIWIGGIGATLLARHFKEKRWVLVEATFTALLLVFFGLFNAEQYIALNHPPTVNERVDYTYLSRMSPDGYEGWRKAYKDVQNTLLESDLKDKETLDKHDRQKLFYTGLELRSLIKNYHNLAEHNASDDEWKDYYKAVLTYQLEQTNSTLGQFGPETQHMTANLNSYKKNVEESLQKLSQSSDEKNPSLITLRPRSYYMDNNSNYLCNYDTIYSYVDKKFTPQCLYTFFSTFEGREPQLRPERGSWNRLMTWNQGETTAHQRIRGDMPISELLNLQKKYFELVRKVLSQPDNERDYEVDISFDTPFLEPL